ncbi:hypothetical protein [Streptomyces sp. NRRL B-24484]|uniref:hypothetical protein n=1 Tax=Streptomyces sp. NRRL B-24484 TaxID=1463833 RepID=UPI000694A44D|nr:hypothetical protein [Streptomyces sp. NRRL B-24484]
MGGAEPRAPERGHAPWPPIDLLGRIRHDPAHMAERAALFGVERLGRESVERLAKMRAKVPPERLKDTVVERGVHTAIAEGAFVGGPFMGLIPVMFCAALLAQGRMVLELAELSGRSATDPERAVDMLVLQGAHPTREEARRAIAALPEAADRPGPTTAPAAADDGAADDGAADGEPPPKLSLREWLRVVERMAYVLGVISPGGSSAAAGRLRYLRWAGVALLVAVGLMLPFVWVPVLGVAYRSATLRLATRASILFGLVEDERDEATKTRGRGRVRPLAMLVALRTIAVLVVPFAVSVLMVFTGAHIANQRWLAVAAGVVGVSIGSCLVWRFRQWRQHGH